MDCYPSSLIVYSYRYYTGMQQHTWQYMEKYIKSAVYNVYRFPSFLNTLTDNINVHKWGHTGELIHTSDHVPV